MTRLPTLLALVALLAGCGWNDDRGLIVDPSDDYLEAQAAPPLAIPEDMDERSIVHLLEIPKLPRQPQVEFYPGRAPRPEAIYAREESSGVKIQRLGDRSWLVIAEPPAVVWPKVKQFLADNGVGVAFEEPADGRIDTVWLTLAGGEHRDVVRLALDEARRAASQSTGRDRLRIQVEQGIRPRTTEIHIRHENDADRFPQTQWPEKSDIPAMEREMLNELGAYIAADVADDSVSLVAQNIGSGAKASLERDGEGNPVLILNLDFNRAWATIGQALSNAEVEVTDLDRSAGVYFVTISQAQLTGDQPGVFSRLFGGGDGDRAVRIHVDPGDEGYQVSVYNEEDQPVGGELGQQVLVLLREFAS